MNRTQSPTATYCLAYRGLALLVQEGWGGIYMDNQAQAASLAELFGHCQALIDRADAHPFAGFG